MTRVFLLLLLGVAAALFFPASRTAIVEKTLPALDPAFRWQTMHEMGMIADEVSIYERDNDGRVPAARSFTGWIEANFTPGAAKDSWGAPYGIVEDGETFAVVSWGADRKPRTSDDLRVPRRLTRPR